MAQESSEHIEAARPALIARRWRATSARTPATSRIPRRSHAGPVPLSAAQKRLWILHQLDPGSPASNRPLALRLTGRLDQTALTQSLNGLVRRHETLRTIFPNHHGEPVQVVLPFHPLTIGTIDLQHLPETSREAEAQRIAAVESQQTFDLSKGLLTRVVLLRLAELEHVLLLLMHHIQFDGWSEGILLRDLGAFYEAFSRGTAATLEELPIQYADFALWQQEQLRGEGIEKHLRYWEQQLEGMPPALMLSTDYPRTDAPTSAGVRYCHVLPTSLAERLKDLGRNEHVTLFMTLLSAFQVLLGRYAGQLDVVVGTPIAGRTHVETEQLIGCFMNVLVLRTDLSGDPTFRKLLERVRESALHAYAHQEVPFEKLVEKLRPQRLSNRWPLFQVMFHLRNIPRPEANGRKLCITPFPLNSGHIGGLDLTLEVMDSDEGLRCTFRYASELFQAQTIERMAGHWATLLEAIVADPDRRITTLPLSNRQERHQLLVEWNQTETDYESDTCIHELFEAQVNRAPDAVAVVFEEQQLTYRQLNRRANQLAHLLRKLGVGPEVLVGICMERSLEMVVGLLGVLKAGGAYVPLDPSYPDERLAFMVQDTQASILLTQKHLSQGLPKHQGRVVYLDPTWQAIAQEDDENTSSGVSAENLAYVMYTSGSTGKPKGVMACHRGCCNYLYWRRSYFPLTPADRLLQKSSFCFDDSFWEFFEPLVVGAQLIIARPGMHEDSAYLVQQVCEHQITALCLVPSMLQAFLDEPKVEMCSCLRRVTTGGEALSVGLQERFFSRLAADLHNGYGPTEATVSATFWTCKRGRNQRPVPIGRPIANTQIYLLDSHLQPVPIGLPGEIHISGVGLSRGYLNRPHLTAEKFLANPFSNSSAARLYRTGDLARYLPDGNLEFLGRIDQQVKIRGYRIELGEVEAVLGRHPAVREALVVAQEENLADPSMALGARKRLLAYVVSVPGRRLPVGELRSFLRKILPSFMVPSAFVVLDALPQTPNGKINRSALPIPQTGRSQSDQTYVDPRDETERQIAAIWRQVFGLEKIGIHDNFFDLGGHSLLAMQVVSRLRDAFQVRLSLRCFFDAQTIAGVAEAVRRTGASSL